MPGQNESPVTVALSILELMIGRGAIFDMASVPQHLRDISAAIEAIQKNSTEAAQPAVSIIKGMIQSGAVKTLGEATSSIAILGQALLNMNSAPPAVNSPLAPAVVQVEAPATPPAKRGGRPPKAKPDAEPAVASQKVAPVVVAEHKTEPQPQTVVDDVPAPKKARRSRPKSVPVEAPRAEVKRARAAQGDDTPPRRQKQPLKAADANGKLIPAVHPKDSVTGDFIICLEDGKKMKMLKKHLNIAFGITPDEYRKRWGLPENYPMVAPNYARQKSRYARSIGLGTSAMRSEVASKREREHV